MPEETLLSRTKSFALRVINVTRALPSDSVSQVLGRQLLRAGTSVGANYRAARRGKSSADFLNKLKIAEEEWDESIYWMELLAESGVVPLRRHSPLMREADELLSMLVASIKTVRHRTAAFASVRPSNLVPRTS